MANAKHSGYPVSVQSKICTKCGVEKSADEFYREPTLKSGLHSHCKECSRNKSKNYRINNPERVRTTQQKWYEDNSDKVKAYSRQYYDKNAEKARAYSRQWRLDNSARHKENLASWRAENKDRITAYNSNYHKATKDHRRPLKAQWARDNAERLNAKKREDRKNNPDKYRRYDERRMSMPERKINNRFAGSIRHRLRQNGAGKGGKHWEELVGYTLTDLMMHLERQFTKGMSWDNYGRGGWNIDHIIPASSFKYDTPDDPEFKACWALTNLQPLWEKENISKHAKRLTLL